MEVQAAAFLASGLACVGAGLSAVGIGIIFATTAPEKARRSGVLVTTFFGIACLAIALLMIFGL